ncbi:hypothetical protein GCM10027567_30970 [Spongiibacter taiwanensis]
MRFRSRLGHRVAKIWIKVAQVVVVDLASEGAAFAALAGEFKFTAELAKALGAVIYSVADMLVSDAFAETDVHFW